METIIQEIAEKIIKENTKNIEEMLLGHMDISKYILQTKEMLDGVGVRLVEKTMEATDEIIRNSENRKENWHIQRRDDEKTLLTIFGQVRYVRTYYQHKTHGTYGYISDEILGIQAHARMDMSLQSKIVEQSIDLSYQKSGKIMGEKATVSNQTVMNTIRKLDNIDNSYVEIMEENKTIDIIFIEADEDHVAMQDGSNKQVKLVYVHEGIKQIGKKRYKLINPRYFAGTYTNSEELWLKVAEYLDKAYNLDKTKKIYLSGDGAGWIKEGLNWITGSRYVLDSFHLSKYIKRATAHMPHTTKILYDYIFDLNLNAATDLLNAIISATESQSKMCSIRQTKQYIINNWDGIVRMQEKEYIGCSAEGHVSHILSARLSSRPLGWCLAGANQMAKLRVHRANGGNVYNLILNKNKELKKEKAILNLDKRVVRSRLNKFSRESLDNITIINIGKKTATREFLKSIRSA